MREVTPAQSADPDRLLDLSEAAEVVRKPVGTVRHYIHHRKLPAIKIGKSYLIKLKGSEVGFSLVTIENTLRLKNEWKLVQRQVPDDRHQQPGSRPAPATQRRFAK